MFVSANDKRVKLRNPEKVNKKVNKQLLSKKNCKMILNTLCVEVTDGSWTNFKRFASVSHIYYFCPLRFNWRCAEKKPNQNS